MDAHYALKADGQTSFFKLMSRDYHGEVAKFSELVWFRIPAKQPKLAEQWRGAHWVGKSERSDAHWLAIRGSTYSAKAIRRKPRDELSAKGTAFGVVLGLTGGARLEAQRCSFFF